MRVLALVVLASSAPVALAQTITFETIPGVVGEAPEGLAIGDQFNVAPYFVRFERIDDQLRRHPATLAKIGPAVPGYMSPTARAAFIGVSRPDSCDGDGDGRFAENVTADMPAAGLPYDPGCFFLTDDGLHGPGVAVPDIQDIVVTYTVPVMEASGYILDIDNDEEFTISARDANDTLVAATIRLQPGAQPNGKATFWGVQGSAPIHSILIHYTGTGDSKGIAFDEFSPATICPSQITHRGGGIPGTGGAVPALSLTCPSIGQSGEIEVFNGLGGAHGCLGISLTPPTVGLRCRALPLGAEYLARPQFLFPHTLSGSAGAEGRFKLSYAANAIPATLRNQKVYLQAGYCDAGAPCELALTEIVEATIR